MSVRVVGRSIPARITIEVSPCMAEMLSVLVERQVLGCEDPAQLARVLLWLELERRALAYGWSPHP